MYAQNKRKKEKQEKQEYQRLLVQINRDNEYLSTKKKEMIYNLQTGIEVLMNMTKIVVI